MGLIRNLLDRNFFPDNDWTRDKNGDPDPALRSFDRHHRDEFMGVRVDHIAGPLNAETKLITEAPLRSGQGRRGQGRVHAQRKARQRLQGGEPAAAEGNRGQPYRRSRTRTDAGRLPGLGRLGSRPQDRCKGEDRRQTLMPVPSLPSSGTHPLKRLRIGALPALLRRQRGRGLDALAAGAVRL